jgi:hypothetical protein
MPVRPLRDRVLVKRIDALDGVSRPIATSRVAAASICDNRPLACACGARILACEVPDRLRRKRQRR